MKVGELYRGKSDIDFSIAYKKNIMKITSLEGGNVSFEIIRDESNVPFVALDGTKKYCISESLFLENFEKLGASME